MPRFALRLTNPDGDRSERYVETCCAQSALTAIWDEDGARLDDGDYEKEVIWSEDAEDGTPDVGVQVCEDCAEDGVAVLRTV